MGKPVVGDLNGSGVIEQFEVDLGASSAQGGLVSSSRGLTKALEDAQRRATAAEQEKAKQEKRVDHFEQSMATQCGQAVLKDNDGRFLHVTDIVVDFDHANGALKFSSGGPNAERIMALLQTRFQKKIGADKVEVKGEGAEKQLILSVSTQGKIDDKLKAAVRTFNQAIAGKAVSGYQAAVGDHKKDDTFPLSYQVMSAEFEQIHRPVNGRG